LDAGTDKKPKNPGPRYLSDVEAVEEERRLQGEPTGAMSPTVSQ
jgi:hypothetical protein